MFFEELIDDPFELIFNIGLVSEGLKLVFQSIETFFRFFEAFRVNDRHFSEDGLLGIIQVDSKFVYFSFDFEGETEGSF